ncbi:chorismate mutase [Candidatus Gracilibacteria bacterium]|nr:chorismate mutase [Candidatus Gracilibacteria bacterium]
MLNQLRQQIDKVDNELLLVLKKRMDISRQMGEYKKNKDLEIKDPNRWEEVLQSRINKGVELGLDPDLVRELYDSVIHKYSQAQQH